VSAVVRPAVPGAEARSLLDRQEQILEEERGQLRAAGQAGLLVDRNALLPGGAFADVAGPGHLLQAQALEHQQGDLPLRGGEAPALELLVDRRAQPGDEVIRLLLPAPGLIEHPIQLPLVLLQLQVQEAEVARQDDGQSRHRAGEDADLHQNVGQGNPGGEVREHVRAHQPRDAEEEQR